MKATTSTFLNALRWMAAFLVLIGHARHLLWVDYAAVEHKSLMLKGLYFVTGFGHEAVVLFFVISGFLVGGTTLQKWRLGGVDQRSFWIARISRIYTVLIPALVLGLLLDGAGSQWLDAHGLYSNPEAFHTISLDNGLQGSLTASTFLANLLMLQGLWAPNLGSNSPLWSLAYEWWYYVLFSLACAAWLQRGAARALGAAGLVLLLALLPLKVLLWGLLWAIGLVTFFVSRSHRTRLSPWLGVLLFGFALFASRLSHNAENLAQHESLMAEFLRDFGVALGTAFAILGVNAAQHAIPGERLHARLADCSYSLYLVHFPLMLVTSAALLDSGWLGIQQQPDTKAVGALLLMILALSAAAWCFADLVERRTPAVRRWLGRLWSARTAP